MQVTNDVTIHAAARQTAAQPSISVDYNAFLRLLIAQMKHQDPTNPMESSEYVAQLATFSSVEQAVQTNSKLDALLTSFALAQADGIIGRTISSPDGSVVGEVASVRIVSGGAVAVLSDGQELKLGPGVTIT
ncbi:MAG TPA: flagellar hook assembly protein FlgD [Hyphomicrobiaceae bacterium]|nr:flagellar hook assembly protein FlgD [Hyphomicrobiaceae bacterium]